jgi:hypothetical protein
VTAFTTRSPGGWPHPLALVSHMLDVQLFGLNAGGHHLTSVLLHGAAAIFLFLSLLELTAEIWRAAFVAAVFALHPLQVESVAWVAERKTVLNGFLVMLCLWLYARRKKTAALAAFFFALLARSVSISTPFFLLLLDEWPRKRRELKEKIPFLALAACAAGLALATAESVSPGSVLPLSARCANALVGVSSYLWRTLWPANLCVFYPYERAIPFSTIAFSGAVFVLISGVVFSRAKKSPWLAVGWAWFLVALAPYAGLVQVGAQATADRYMYLPLAGLAISAAWGVPALLGEKAAAVAGAFCLCALMICSGLQLRWWQDGVSLFTRVVAVHPESATAHNNLGAALYAQGDIEGAAEEYRAGIALDPRHGEAHNNLAVALTVLGRPDEAVKESLAALALDPGNAKARETLEREKEILSKRAQPRPPRPNPRPRK